MRLLWLAAAVLAAQTPVPKYIPPPPPQPLPFSHRQHAAAGLDCKTCHAIPEPGEFAGLPVTGVCMNCHIEIRKDSPHIQRLAGYHKEGKPVPWARVYRIPGYVFFSHKEHLARAGATCETCHGPVWERDVLRKERETSMAACMDCHRAKGASLDCLYCHDQR